MKEVNNLKLQTAEDINSLFAVTIIGRGYMIDHVNLVKYRTLNIQNDSDGLQLARLHQCIFALLEN